ncbi:hypothetical protein TSOC_010430 [Tetrabaena socialis]|uniref:CS domain-containing protein n=1 Tax=Tetrabaena socialis TaxID=47790 RepID=A0A2J7ZTA9_9CHLO|nr:hypothetical protein TSOC_010430 [Tetrabaena socialis]|eukprot:PNH03506.1 hypothetical protein TSOC_010430 [Tetrabaena socialis]
MVPRSNSPEGGRSTRCGPAYNGRPGDSGSEGGCRGMRDGSPTRATRSGAGSSRLGCLLEALSGELLECAGRQEPAALLAAIEKELRSPADAAELAARGGYSVLLACTHRTDAVQPAAAVLLAALRVAAAPAADGGPAEAIAVAAAAGLGPLPGGEVEGQTAGVDGLSGDQAQGQGQEQGRGQGGREAAAPPAFLWHRLADALFGGTGAAPSEAAQAAAAASLQVLCGAASTLTGAAWVRAAHQRPNGSGLPPRPDAGGGGRNAPAAAAAAAAGAAGDTSGQPGRRRHLCRCPLCAVARFAVRQPKRQESGGGAAAAAADGDSGPGALLLAPDGLAQLAAAAARLITFGGGPPESAAVSATSGGSCKLAEAGPRAGAAGVRAWVEASGGRPLEALLRLLAMAIANYDRSLALAGRVGEYETLTYCTVGLAELHMSRRDLASASAAFDRCVAACGGVAEPALRSSLLQRVLPLSVEVLNMQQPQLADGGSGSTPAPDPEAPGDGGGRQRPHGERGPKAEASCGARAPKISGAVVRAAAYGSSTQEGDGKYDNAGDEQYDEDGLRTVWDSGPRAEVAATRAQWAEVPLRERVSWVQTSTDVYVTVRLPPGTRRAEVSVSLQPERLALRLGWCGRVVDGPLHRRVRAADSVWSMEGDSLQVLLAKAEAGHYWRALFEGGEEKGLYQVLQEAVDADEPVVACDQLDEGARALLAELLDRQAAVAEGEFDLENSFDDFRLVVGDGTL